MTDSLLGLISTYLILVTVQFTVLVVNLGCSVALYYYSLVHIVVDFQ